MGSQTAPPGEASRLPLSPMGSPAAILPAQPLAMEKRAARDAGGRGERKRPPQAEQPVESGQAQSGKRPRAALADAGNGTHAMPICSEAELSSSPLSEENTSPTLRSESSSTRCRNTDLPALQDTPVPLLENDRDWLDAMQRRVSVPSASSSEVSSSVSALERTVARENVSALFPLLPAACRNADASDEECASNQGEASARSQNSSLDPAETLALVPINSEAEPPAEENTHEEAAPGAKNRPRFGKPVEARVAGSAAPWKRFPTLKMAQDVTGIPTDYAKALCDSGREYLGWEFRWPEQACVEASIDASDGHAVQAAEQGSLDVACDVGALARRIRAVPSAARRRLVAALPEATRNALSQHLRSPPPPSPDTKPAAVPDLNVVISTLPEVLRNVPQEARCKVLAGVRDLGERHQALLLAPDIASVAKLLREVLPAQRRALLEALPEATQQALREHMLAEKAAAAGK